MSARLRLLACGVWICATAACSPSVDFERMRQQPRVDPYAASAAFSNGMTMRVPPAGAVPALPVRSSVAGVDRGRHEYEIFCAVCHGADGSGRSVMASNMPEHAPPPLVSGDAVGLSDSEWLDIIAHGREHMPAYDWALPAEERAAVIAYVRTLQRGAQ